MFAMFIVGAGILDVADNACFMFTGVKWPVSCATDTSLRAL